VIFGERGVGKTSVAAMSAAIARYGGRIAMRINCDHSDNFHSLWQKVIDEFAVLVAAADDDSKDALDAAVEKATDVLNYSDDTGPNQVRVAFRQIAAIAPVVIFFDEFDQIVDTGTLNLVSNTIKLLSDQLEDVTLVPVGVSDSVAGLIAGHVSIQRNLVQVRMPRMTREEIEGILDNGLHKLGMSIDDDGRRFVRRGLPQYAHLLAQEGARRGPVP
jgi:Cdc6-like AAA superfamily ATPase